MLHFKIESLLLLYFSFQSLFAGSSQVNFFPPVQVGSTDWGNPGANTFPKFTGDFDGDGLADLAVFYTNGLWISLSESNYFPVFTYKLNGLSQAHGWVTFERFPRLMADFTGDGRLDLVGFHDLGIVYCMSSPTGGFNSSFVLLGGISNRYTSFTLNPRFAGDINGDGKKDIIIIADEGVYVLYSNGPSFNTSGLLLNEFGIDQGWTNQGIYPRAVADINGDGKDDIIGFKDNGVYVAYSNGTGFLTPELLSNEFGTLQGWRSFDLHPRLLGDVDGDGKADIVGFKDDGVYVSYSNGTGFSSPVLLFRDFATQQGYISFDAFPRFVADFNGDGRVEILGVKNQANYVSYSIIVDISPDNNTSNNSCPSGMTCIPTGSDFCKISGNQCVNTSSFSPSGMTCIPTGSDYCHASGENCVNPNTFCPSGKTCIPTGSDFCNIAGSQCININNSCPSGMTCIPTGSDFCNISGNQCVNTSILLNQPIIPVTPSSSNIFSVIFLFAGIIGGGLLCLLIQRILVKCPPRKSRATYDGSGPQTEPNIDIKI